MQKVTLVPGDGIGPEITESVKQVLAAAGAKLEWEEMEIGLAAYEKTGELMPDSFVQGMNETRIALKGPTTTPVGGGHRSINVQMRQQFKLFTNVRPIKTIPGLKNRYENVDLIIVRENSEDLYKGIEYKVDDDTAQGIKLITVLQEELQDMLSNLLKSLEERK